MKKVLCFILILLVMVSQRVGSYSSFSGMSGMGHENRPFDSLELPSESAPLGGILPHHLVASPMIEQLLSTLSDGVDNPETIIILGPNHKRVGDRMIHTGDFTWNTPYGSMETDKEMVKKLVKSFSAGVIPTLLEEEHSISALVPSICRAFPLSRIVPVLIHGNMKREDCIRLSQFLAKEAEEKSCLILASIDFSHGLKPADAFLKDETTQSVIEERDYGRLFGLDNAYLDAPPTLAAFLMTMDLIAGNSAQSILLEHAEASRFLKHPVPETTSYMTYIFKASGDGS